MWRSQRLHCTTALIMDSQAKKLLRPGTESKGYTNLTFQSWRMYAFGVVVGAINSALMRESLLLSNRNCLNLQYLSLAYCNRVTDEGFRCLAKEKLCYNLIYLDLSGCTQVSGKSSSGFRLQSLRSLGLSSKNPAAPLTRVLTRSWLRSVGAQRKQAD